MERGMASPEPRVVQCDAKAPPPSTEKKRQGSKKRPNPRGQSMPAQGNSAYTSRGTHEDGSEFRKFYTRGDLPCYISHGFARQLQVRFRIGTGRGGARSVLRGTAGVFARLAQDSP